MDKFVLNWLDVRSNTFLYMYASDTVNIIKFRDSSSGITNQYHHYIQQLRCE